MTLPALYINPFLLLFHKSYSRVPPDQGSGGSYQNFWVFLTSFLGCDQSNYDPAGFTEGYKDKGETIWDGLRL